MRTPPALDTWRRELKGGKRTPATFDALWRSACAEQWALEHAAVGLPGIAESNLRESRRILRAALKEAA